MTKNNCFYFTYEVTEPKCFRITYLTPARRLRSSSGMNLLQSSAGCISCPWAWTPLTFLTGSSVRLLAQLALAGGRLGKPEPCSLLLREGAMRKRDRCSAVAVTACAMQGPGGRNVRLASMAMKASWWAGPRRPRVKAEGAHFHDSIS